MFKANIKDTRTTIVFFDIEHISELFLVFLLLTLSMYYDGNRFVKQILLVKIMLFLNIYGLLTFYDCC